MTAPSAVRMTRFPVFSGEVLSGLRLRWIDVPAHSDSGAPPQVRGCVSAVRDLVPLQIDAPGIPVTVRGTLTLP